MQTFYLFFISSLLFFPLSAQSSSNTTNTTCPKGTYFDSTYKKCRLCPSNCVDCLKNNSVVSCSQCAPGYDLSANATCSFSCNSTSFFDLPTNSCLPCSNVNCTKCQTRMETGGLVCSSCVSGFYLASGACLSKSDATCPQGQYFSNSLKGCSNCPKNCTTCKSGLLGMPYCMDCMDGYFLLLGFCLDAQNAGKWTNSTNSSNVICPDGQFFSLTELKCESCPQNCTKCRQALNGSVSCYECPSGFVSFLGLCLPQDSVNNNRCPYAFYWNDTIQNCSACQDNCSKCAAVTFVDNSTNTTTQQLRCLECVKNFQMSDRVCKKICSAGTVYNSSSDNCVACPQNCSTCYISQIDTINCTACSYGNVFNEDKTCVFAATNAIACPAGEFLNYSSSNCSKCPNNCSKCYLFDNQFSSSLDTLNFTTKCIFCNGKGQYFSQFYGKCLDCQSRLGFGCLSCSSPSACSQCDKAFSLNSDGKCALSQCQAGYYNDGTGCYQCNSTCKSCYGPTAQNCLDCPGDQILVRGGCQSKVDVQKALGMLNNSNISISDLSNIGSALSSLFKRNATHACNADPDCLNNGTCSLTFVCKCLPGFWGSNCNFTKADAQNASSKNIQILSKFSQDLNSSDASQSKSICAALVDMTSVKEINDDQTVNQSLSLLNLLAKNSKGLSSDVSSLMVNAISNVIGIVSSNSSNSSNGTSAFIKNAKKTVENLIASQISSLDSSGVPLIIKTTNLQVKISKLDSSKNNSELQIELSGMFSDQDMDSLNSTNSSNLVAGQTVSTSFSGNIVFNDNFLNAIKNQASPAVSFTKWTSNPYQDQDNTTISSSVISFSVMANGSKVNISNLTNPIQIQIPKTKNANANYTFSCQFWNETTSQWSTDGVTLVSESAQAITCNVTHLTDFAGAEVQVVSTNNSTNTGNFGIKLVSGLGIFSLIMAFLMMV